jgi:hypothetical protein
MSDTGDNQKPTGPVQQALLAGAVAVRPCEFGYFAVGHSGWLDEAMTQRAEWSIDYCTLSEGRISSTVGVDPTPEERHAIAALALHGQPFGFTWEDVDWLRAMADWAEEYGVAADGPAWVNALADRIAALLPPREEPDETEEILSDPEAMKRIRTGLDELERGDVVSFEDVFEEPL